MVRPCRKRRVCWRGRSNYFKPAGVPLNQIDEIELGLDEIEALRLSDAMGLDQKTAAEKMNISQPTFNRVLNSARNKVAKAIVESKAIKIQEGL